MMLVSSSAVAQWIELRTLNYDNPGSNDVLPCQTVGRFFHYTLLQVSQLYECVHGYR